MYFLLLWFNDVFCSPSPIGCTVRWDFIQWAFFAITLLQSMISVSVDMLPLPGGMGISETLYIRMFEPVFGDLLLPSMLLSRGLSYYGQMLISAIMTCVAYFVIRDDTQTEKKEKSVC